MIKAECRRVEFVGNGEDILAEFQTIAFAFAEAFRANGLGYKEAKAVVIDIVECAFDNTDYSGEERKADTEETLEGILEKITKIVEGGSNKNG